MLHLEHEVIQPIVFGVCFLKVRGLELLQFDLQSLYVCDGGADKRPLEVVDGVVHPVVEWLEEGGRRGKGGGGRRGRGEGRGGISAKCIKAGLGDKAMATRSAAAKVHALKEREREREREASYSGTLGKVQAQCI